MLHPDTNFTPTAGTSFSSGKTFVERPWVADPGTPEDRTKAFHQSKLHCSVPGYEYVAAAELMGMSVKGKKTMNVSLKDILQHWKGTESHGVFEAHLPQLIPLYYVEEVYIPKIIFESLHRNAQESAQKIFGDSLHLTNHKIDNNLDSNRKIRQEYQNEINKQLIEKFQQRMEKRKNLQGTVVTLAPSGFADQILSPLNIHRLQEQTGRKTDAIYIYWQAMHGDMMITLTDKLLDEKEMQPHLRCLVAYIAGIPPPTESAIDHYVEDYSYLNLGQPYQHAAVINHQTFKDNSRTFHKGCNIDGFLTYCLKLDKSNGTATLSHAGPNSIYCLEKITYQFRKTEIDFNRLAYIYVSAGSRRVPVRNLTVNFAPITDLNPSFDHHFKGGDNKAPSAKSPSFLRKAANAAANFLRINMDEKSKSNISMNNNHQNRIFFILS